MTKLRFQPICRRQETSHLTRTIAGYLYCHRCTITKLFAKSRGLFEDILGLFIIHHLLPFFYFLTLETGEFTGHAKATFPYLLVAKDGQTIYSPNCVLKGFCLSDPDHLTGLEITNLYSHWLGHQKIKLQPFVISNAGPLHRMFVEKSEKAKGKKKMEYVNVSSRTAVRKRTGRQVQMK